MTTYTKVKCTNCNWVGKEDGLFQYFDEVEMSNLEKCPNCDYAWGLNNVEQLESRLKNETL